MLQVKNRAVSSLASGIDDSVESLTVATGEGAKFPQPGDGFHITIDDEILKCTARTTDTLTVTRAQEGTSATAHSSGAAVSLNITAGIIAELQAAAIPSGLIVMWHGSIANIPSGWVICDGNNGTPNLLAKFVQGVATAETDQGATGGEATHTLTVAELPKPTAGADGFIYYDSPNGNMAGLDAGSVCSLAKGLDTAHENKPPFYDVAFIMKT